MSSDRIRKYALKFKEKFQSTFDQFDKFLMTRVQLTQNQRQYLMNIIRQTSNSTSQKFSDENLIKYLHMTAALQKNADLESIKEVELKKYTKINFYDQEKKREMMEKQQMLEKQKANEMKKKEESKQEKKRTQKVEIKDELQAVRSSKKSSKITEDYKPPMNQIQQKTQEYAVSSQNPCTNVDKNTQSKQSKTVSKQQSKKNAKKEVVECNQEQEVSIPDFDKFGQDFWNPVIKYQVKHKKNVTWRRYSEFQKLMKYLQKTYEGIALPELPPKQGIKGGINYLWGSSIDTVFLNERREKLENWLNRLLKCQFVQHNENLQQFLSDESFQIPDVDAVSYTKLFSGYTDIVFNYSELKDYGMAYYKYVTEQKTKPIETPITDKFRQIQDLISVILETNHHRKAINDNFNKRRQILYNYSEKVRPICRTELDKVLQQAQIECQQVIRQHKKYIGLKMRQNWLYEVMKQKKNNITASVQQDYDKTTERVEKIEQNLMKSLEQFQKSKKKLLITLGENLIKWRCENHP